MKMKRIVMILTSILLVVLITTPGCSVAKTDPDGTCSRNLSEAKKEVLRLTNENKKLNAEKPHDPTSREMTDLLAEDDTNEQKYNWPDFESNDFAIQLRNRAMAKNIRCGLVFVYMDGGKKCDTINVFNTTDREKIYIEPQADQEVTVRLNESYRGQNGFDKALSYDDTIYRILESW